ncbi:MAG: BolA/IbaG family iron-sulfur metabolism protein [Deltaproteobacteria bacterium]|jgi:stress-induced morphogen|nr:BolA/IbaG family iron-sulfur metabolism protein [Deltaproteobacteria bacterium]MBW2383304.1 BolA/IbaG family iron-sulfur metabolism protein [Deltaproteobacteria bacterium]MBW2696761.1 BolA/IbaG family iron-sulfur metabolism protein [Deltaproteobacteria bacterium]
MAIHVTGGSGASEVVEAIRGSILEAIPNAEVRVSTGGPGHFEIRVESPVFEGQRRVQQQQLVYGAIAHLMAGSDAPVHAVDRLECVSP